MNESECKGRFERKPFDLEAANAAADAAVRRFFKGRVQPFVRVRDLNNGPDTHGDNRPVPAAEAGIRISF